MTTKLTVEDMVRREVVLCVSSLVSMLALDTGYPHAEGMDELTEQALRLGYSLEDYEEAARQEGWCGPFTDDFGATFFKCDDGSLWAVKDWEGLCAAFDIDPYEREIFEHWAVSPWLAEKLTAKGERVDMDFAGFCVWGRTTTGQGIAQDSVIQEIYVELMAL